ncbi:nucleoside deaminase [Arcticibacter sp. MXS-1]|uniref:nucleoside deaminase n=1 Tax=Arcticibacter sp. MXS-1 TaxID=3341726 RepID=UPI0035A969FA
MQSDKTPQGHEDYMRLAIALSQKNVEQGGGGPFGAVIVKDGEIIAQSSNAVTSSNDPTAHAEVSAIRLAAKALNSFDLSGCVIYTSCEPCPMCLGAIYWSRISKIFFANTREDAEAIGFDDKLIYEEINRPMSERQLPAEQVLHSEALEVFQSWKQETNKTHY